MTFWETEIPMLTVIGSDDFKAAIISSTFRCHLWYLCSSTPFVRWIDDFAPAGLGDEDAEASVRHDMDSHQFVVAIHWTGRQSAKDELGSLENGSS